MRARRIDAAITATVTLLCAFFTALALLLSGCASRTVASPPAPVVPSAFAASVRCPAGTRVAVELRGALPPLVRCAP